MIGNKKIRFEIKFVITIVLLCTYIIPIAEFSAEDDYKLPKYIFVGSISLIYILSLKKILLKEILFNLIILICFILTKNFNYLIFITIIYIEKFIKNKNDIIEYLKESNILYICLLFTIFYSILYAGYQGRYAFTAIKEINQSGLSIFCLGIMLMLKNKKLGVAVLIFGMLTLSRSYYLALFIYVILKSKFFYSIFNEKNIRRCNFLNLTILSSIMLVLLGFFYIQQYSNGNIIFAGDSAKRLITFLDLSNYCRFSAIAFLILSYKDNIFTIFTGISDMEFYLRGKQIADNLGVLHIYTIPHNLFFSHLKMYGIFAIIEIIYVSNLLKKIVNKKNFSIYIGIVLYSIFLGAGLYSYWLYLTIFTLFSEDGKVIKKEDENEFSERNNTLLQCREKYSKMYKFPKKSNI